MTGYMPGQYAKSLRRRIVWYNGRRYTVTRNRKGAYTLMVHAHGASHLVMTNL